MNRPDYTDKANVREYFLKKRNSLSAKQVELKSQAIVEQVFHLNRYQQAKTIHTFVTISENNEVDTHQLINKSFENSKTVVVPKILNSGKLEHIQIQSLKELKPNNWGVPEPEQNNQIPIRKIDLVFVPMVAGDRQKNRIGYGKGYYDRFLSETEAYKIGLLFDCQLSQKIIPTQFFDVPLDMLITESQQIV